MRRWLTLKRHHWQGQKHIDESKRFGREYLIPGPLEPNLILEIAPAVAKAAMDSGVATLPVEDMKAYRDKLSAFVYNSTFLMKPIFAKAQENPKRIVFVKQKMQTYCVRYKSWLMKVWHSQFWSVALLW